MRVTLVYNPVSGGGRARVAAERAAEAFRAAGHDPEVIASEGEGDATRIAYESAESGAGRLVAIGGDGTAVDVAAGLLASRRSVPMAHVPRGTANVLALNLGIPAGLEEAIAVAVGGIETRIDAGALRRSAIMPLHERQREAADAGHPFLLSVGTGVHAEMVERADRIAKSRWGVLAYVGAGWRAVAATPRTRYRLWLDDEVLEVEGTMVQVMNMAALLRPSWRLARGVSPVDGRLDVIVYHATTKREYLKVMARVLQGRPTATSLVLHRSASRITIDAQPAAPVQRDGEVAGETPVTVEIRPRALPVIVPAYSRWGGAAASPAGSR